MPMWIFQHKELVAGLILSAALVLPYYFALKYERFRIVEGRHVSIFFAVWAAAFSLEYFILGPASYISMETDGRFFTFLYYLANNFNGLRFSHELAGGQDVWAFMPGGQYFSPERLLLNIFDPWVVLLLHKLMVGALGFFGCYLLARRFDGENRAISVAVAAFFPVSHLYLLDYSVEFSTGFAAIPWGVYACTVRTRQKGFIFWVLLASVILAAAPPVKVFPALFLALVGFALLRPDIDYRKAVAGFSFIVAVSILNWHEVLYAYLQISPFASRGVGLNSGAVTMAGIIPEAFTALKDLWLSIILMVPTWLLAASMIVLAVTRDRFFLKSLGVLVWFFVTIVLVNVFPWQIVGMGFMKALEHDNMRLSLAVLAVPIAARALALICAPKSDPTVFSRFLRPDVAILAIALSILTWNKFLNASKFVAFGGQTNRLEYRDLKNPVWKSADDYRVVTPFGTPRPNVTAAYYGLDSFDGSSLLQPKTWNDYWRSIRRLPAFKGSGGSRTPARITPDWRFLNGQTYDIAAHVRLDLLRIANVRYVLSALPLKGDGLKLIVTPKAGEHIRTPAGTFASKADYVSYRIRRIFDPGRYFIYELSSALPKVFVARGIETVAGNIAMDVLSDRVEATALSRTIIVSQTDARRLGQPRDMKIEAAQKVADGYDITIDAPRGGILVLNNNYLPFWQARADGRPLTIVPANAIHMAITVPPGAREITVRYSRPLLREKITGFLIDGNIFVSR